MRKICCRTAEVLYYMNNFLLVPKVPVGRWFGETMRGDRHQREDDKNTYKCLYENPTRLDIRGPSHFKKVIFVLQVVGILKQVSFDDVLFRRTQIWTGKVILVLGGGKWDIGWPLDIITIFSGSRWSRKPSHCIDSVIESSETSIQEKYDDLQDCVVKLNNMGWDDCNQTFTSDPLPKLTQWDRKYSKDDRYYFFFRISW